MRSGSIGNSCRPLFRSKQESLCGFNERLGSVGREGVTTVLGHLKTKVNEVCDIKKYSRLRTRSLIHLPPTLCHHPKNSSERLDNNTRIHARVLIEELCHLKGERVYAGCRARRPP